MSKAGKSHIFGWVLSGLAAALFGMSATMKLTANPQAVTMLGQLGWEPSQLTMLGILELSCLILYLLPPVSVLGAIILTGYLGGALATELRMGHPIYMHVLLGFFIWGGLYLREARLHALLPFRRKA